MLRDELKDADIPHHTTINNHIDEVLEEHLTHLGDEMQVGQDGPVIYYYII